jgi:hypothetical protein
MSLKSSNIEDPDFSRPRQRVEMGLEREFILTAARAVEPLEAGNAVWRFVFVARASRTAALIPRAADATMRSGLKSMVNSKRYLQSADLECL